MILNERSNHREWRNRCHMPSLIFKGRLIELPLYNCDFVLDNISEPIFCMLISGKLKALDIAKFLIRAK